jgi:hypothetical protein
MDGRSAGRTVAGFGAAEIIVGRVGARARRALVTRCCGVGGSAGVEVAAPVGTVGQWRGVGCDHGRITTCLGLLCHDRLGGLIHEYAVSPRFSLRVTTVFTKRSWSQMRMIPGPPAIVRRGTTPGLPCRRRRKRTAASARRRIHAKNSLGYIK